MLTPAVFLRATSFGIPTAQPPRTGFGRSFTAITRCGLLFQSKGGPSVTFADRIRQEKSLTPRVIPSLNNFAQTFHTSAVCRSNCDWGRPCDCSECREMFREPICEICKINPTVHISAEWGRDRKGIASYTFTSFCKECLDKKQEEYRVREETEKKIAAANEERLHKMRAADKERMDKMLEHVNSLPPGEQIPIAYAVDKVSSIWGGNSAAWRHRAVRDDFKKELQIVKVKNRWMCDKGRVDAMDFKLWNDTRLKMWRRYRE
ncbi:hypothetical protein NEUTE2DRAFT_92943 [Neurospora tetrasperma FGSC 2509]|nr:hypothetical protein NEUTE2DRAFT_92943 [Neurospora tetrasperma FGSC 2509]